MGNSPKNLEVEVKFWLDDLPAFRERLINAGIPSRHPRTYERNIRFDNAWDGLARRGQLLRLRQDARARLTFKSIPPQPANAEAKVREEIEVEVSDFDQVHTILERIGFLPRQVYEKYRETFVSPGSAESDGVEIGSVEIVLDEMPFGNFVELEGEESALKAVANQIGLNWEKRILDNYLTLMLRLKTQHALPFDDVTFANFAGLNISAAGLFAQVTEDK